MALRIFDSASSRDVLFTPARKKRVGMYVCGPTTYDFAHVGHGRTYLFYDVVKRYLTYLGHKVKHIQNFTDIDENIIRRALAAEEGPLDLSSRFIDEFLKDMDAFGIIRADHYPRTTKHIDDCIELVEELVRKGRAYETNGDVYFRASGSGSFGKLIHEELEEVVVDDLEKVEFANPGRRSILDFAIWKRARPWELCWDSPWGRGRPGWHTECAAMSHLYLGRTVDIHGGGVDLIFPHHESEAVLSEALSGRTSVRYWVHNQFVTFDGEKMAKSKGNLVTMREAIERCGPEVLRFYLLSTHYRKRMPFSCERLDMVCRRLTRYRKIVKRALEGDGGRRVKREADGKALRTCMTDFFAAMDNDFDTPRALVALGDLVRLLERARLKGRVRGTVRKALADIQGILGVGLGIE